MPSLTLPIQVVLGPRPSRLALRTLLFPPLPRLLVPMLMPLLRLLLVVPPSRPLPRELPTVGRDLAPTK
jgi:hypothetical protein